MNESFTCLYIETKAYIKSYYKIILIKVSLGVYRLKQKIILKAIIKSYKKKFL